MAWYTSSIFCNSPFNAVFAGAFSRSLIYSSAHVQLKKVLPPEKAIAQFFSSILFL